MIFILTIICTIPLVSFSLNKPTQAQKQEMQMWIDVTNIMQKAYNDAKAREEKERKAGNKDAADVWRSAAQAFRSVAVSFGNILIEKVDDYYGISAPPGTTIEYNPDSKDYGTTPYTTDKSNIKVIICPKALSDGPGLVASTKIHELEHAWQVWICYSSIPGFWGRCTYMDHWAERGAYDAEERAYDACVTSDMDKKEKDLIKRRRAYHQKKLDQAPSPFTEEDNKRVRAGEEVPVGFVVYNSTNTPQVFNISITDEQGWTITPNFYPGIVLNPEQDIWIVPVVSVPADAEMRTVNPITCVADTGFTSGTDLMMAYISPDVEITPGPEVSGLRGETVFVDFDVTNIGPTADTYTVTMSNPLGWSIGFGTPSLSLASMETKPLSASITIPASLSTTFTTNLMFCTVTSDTYSTQTETRWVPVVVKETDVASMAITEPIATIESGQLITPKVVVRNLGHIDSFFDVYFEIEKDGSPVWSDSLINVSLTAETSQSFDFPAQVLTTGGTYTTRAYTVLAGDANPDNDEATGSFEVVPPSRVKDWMLH